MEWLRDIDGYCERVGPGYWAEPVNALSNLAFVAVALLMWRRGAGRPLARGLSAVLFAIGVGSYLFHTHAQVWAAILDVVPIGLFVLLYIYAVNRNVWGMPPWAAAGVTLLFLPYAALTVPLWVPVPVLGVSAAYMPVPALILIYAALLARRAPATAGGLALGAGILLLSLIARGLDMALCPAIPLGTHFLWHLLNACMLGWMIEVHLRHRTLEGGRAAR